MSYTHLDSMITRLQDVVKKRVGKKKDRPDKAAYIELTKIKLMSNAEHSANSSAIERWRRTNSHSALNYAVEEIIQGRLTDPDSRKMAINSGNALPYVRRVLRARCPELESLYIACLAQGYYGRVLNAYGNDIHTELRNSLSDYITDILQPGDVWEEFEALVSQMPFMTPTGTADANYQATIAEHTRVIGDADLALFIVQLKYLLANSSNSHNRLEFVLPVYYQYLKATKTRSEADTAIMHLLVSMINRLTRFDVSDQRLLNSLTSDVMAGYRGQEGATGWSGIKTLMGVVCNAFTQIIESFDRIYRDNYSIPGSVDQAVQEFTYMWFKNLTTYLLRSDEGLSAKFSDLRVPYEMKGYFLRRREWCFPELHEKARENFSECFAGYFVFIGSESASVSKTFRLSPAQEEFIAKHLNDVFEAGFNLAETDDNRLRRLPVFWRHSITLYVSRVALDRVICFEKLLLKFRDSDTWESYIEALVDLKKNGWVLTK
jgi:hypothetical protein